MRTDSLTGREKTYEAEYEQANYCFRFMNYAVIYVGQKSIPWLAKGHQMELEEIMLRHIANKNLLSMVIMISLLILQNNLDYILYPAASALAYHSWAFCMFFSTPSPFSYICPKAAMAGAAIMSPRWAAFLYKVNALL